MDLSFSRFDRAIELVAWPGDLAALMIGVAARQEASRTACIHSTLIRSGFRAANSDPRLFAPLDGAFNGAVAASLARWRGECRCRRDE